MSSKSVRFSASTKRPREFSGKDNEYGSDEKTKRLRPNEDELDDIDDWRNDEDGNNAEVDGAVPSEREMLEAKRRRRRKLTEGIDEDDTNIDESTSLAHEGIQIEPFHMRREESDGAGYFEGGTYVFRKNDPNEEPDAWLDSLDDSEGKPSSQKSSSSTATPVYKIKEKDKIESFDDLTKEELYSKILSLICEKETVAQAVRRFGQVAKQNQKRKVDAEPRSEEAYKAAKTSLDKLTGMANALLLKGEVDIYDTRRQNILKFIPLGAANSKRQIEPVDGWEYLGNQDGQIHGPYTSKQMLDWMAAGYFVGTQRVKIRSIRKVPLSTKDDLLADLMDDDDDDDNNLSEKGSTETEKEEWQWSDEVDMRNHIA